MLANPQLSLIIPTLNEAENLPLLLPRIASALAGRSYEVLIVDDGSRDDTAAVCAELARTYPLTLIVRTNAWGGLSGAVLTGLSKATGQHVLVMDADLQHAPENIPTVLAPLEKGEADFVIGSRYVEGGKTQEQWSAWRRLFSWGGAMLARPFSGGVKDPLSGFFALARETYAGAKKLTPIGYKIGLELMCKCQVTRVREVPIEFGIRQHGQSKFGAKEQYRYLAHLSRLYDYHFPRASPIAKFIIVLACSWLAAWGVYVLLLSRGATAVWSVSWAYPAAILITAVFHYRYVRTNRSLLIRPAPWRDLWIVSLAEWATCVLAGMWVWARVKSPGRFEVFVLCFAAAAAMRYMLRKEMLLDVRGLRREIRRDELAR